jgi:hypothetical protein
MPKIKRMKKINMVAAMVLSLWIPQTTLACNEVNDNHPNMDERAEAKFISSIEFIEEADTDVDLGFDVYQYLPIDFDPYKGMIYPLEDIEYIEHEEELNI